MASLSPSWQQSLNADFVQRLSHPLIQPGVVNNRMASAIIERSSRLHNRLPLLEQQMQRWSTVVDLETEQTPIIYAQANDQENRTLETQQINLGFQSSSTHQEQKQIPLIKAQPVQVSNSFSLGNITYDNALSKPDVSKQNIINPLTPIRAVPVSKHDAQNLLVNNPTNQLLTTDPQLTSFPVVRAKTKPSASQQLPIVNGKPLVNEPSQHEKSIAIQHNSNHLPVNISREKPVLSNTSRSNYSNYPPKISQVSPSQIQRKLDPSHTAQSQAFSTDAARTSLPIFQQVDNNILSLSNQETDNHIARYHAQSNSLRLVEINDNSLYPQQPLTLESTSYLRDHSSQLSQANYQQDDLLAVKSIHGSEPISTLSQAHINKATNNSNKTSINPSIEKTVLANTTKSDSPTTLSTELVSYHTQINSLPLAQAGVKKSSLQQSLTLESASYLRDNPSHTSQSDSSTTQLIIYQASPSEIQRKLDSYPTVQPQSFRIEAAITHLPVVQQKFGNISSSNNQKTDSNISISQVQSSGLPLVEINNNSPYSQQPLTLESVSYVRDNLLHISRNNYLTLLPTISQASHSQVQHKLTQSSNRQIQSFNIDATKTTLPVSQQADSNISSSTEQETNNYIASNHAQSNSLTLVKSEVKGASFQQPLTLESARYLINNSSQLSQDNPRQDNLLAVKPVHGSESIYALNQTHLNMATDNSNKASIALSAANKKMNKITHSDSQDFLSKYLKERLSVIRMPKTVPKQVPIVQVSSELSSPQLEPLILSKMPIAQQKATTSNKFSATAQTNSGATNSQQFFSNHSQSSLFNSSNSQSVPISNSANFQTSETQTYQVNSTAQATQAANPRENKLPTVDIDKLAEKVERKLRRKFIAESERRGTKKWH